MLGLLLMFTFNFAHAETHIDFVGNKVIITVDDKVRVIEIKQEDIDKGNVDAIMKQVKNAP